MNNWAEVKLRFDEKDNGKEVEQHLHGYISGTNKGIMEALAYMVIDRAEKLKASEGEVMAKLFLEVAMAKTHMCMGRLESKTTDVSELKKALDKLKEDGGPKDD